MKINHKVDGNNISLNYKLKQNEKLRIRNNKGVFSLIIHRNPVQIAGITSLTGDHKHILFLEWDNTCRWIVEKDLEELCKKCGLLFYVFKTKEEEKQKIIIGNYHAICLAKFNVGDIIVFQGFTHCESNYRTMPRRNPFRSWVLRISKKQSRQRPQFIKLIGDKDMSYEISSAHLKAFHDLYKLPKVNYKKKDNLKKYFTDVYESLNY